MFRRELLFAAAALFSLWTVSASAQGLWPDTAYDSAIPTLRTVLGHEPGEAITTPAEVARYLEALAAAAPDRTRLVQYATSWEGRPLHYLMVGSRERIARLDAVKKGIHAVAEGGPAADALLDELPVVVWLLHGVHGNEVSSSDAALAEAYHLLAARGSADVDLTLRDALVIIDPMQNPDGRQRIGARARVQPRRRVGVDVQAGSDPALHRRDHDRRHGCEKPAAAAA